MYHEKIRSQILEGSLADFPGHLSGMYRGYHVSIQNRNAQFIVKINAHMEGDVNNGALAQFLERQKEISRELLKADVFPYMAVLTIKGPNLAKNIPSVLNENLMPVFQFLSGNGYVSGCEQCGSDNGDVHCYEVNGDATSSAITAGANWRWRCRIISSRSARRNPGWFRGWWVRSSVL